jgi:CHAT domain-containing protein
LLSLRAFHSVDFKTNKVGELHWLALLIPADPGKGPEIILEDLGLMEPVVLAHQRLREAGDEEAAQGLYNALFAKLNDALATYDRLYISPDGMLDLVAFARLVLPDGRYWVERQALHQVRTGRDLLHGGHRAKADGMVVFGGVDYQGFGKPDEPGLDARRPSAQSPGDEAAKPILDEGELLAVNERLRSTRGTFGPLEFTGPEANAVSQFYWDYYGRKPTVLKARQASEDRLKALPAPPRVLHLATHGFFLAQKAERIERPLTLSGLALAGANVGMKGERSPGGQDGVLYALEVLDLNLEGTDLVTLSACDTGHGEVDYSDGVYGLVRAFRIAGARNVLMTLWSLNDPLAAEFMRDFYAQWFEAPSRDPAEALRATRLAWIKSGDPKRSDPTYWAPYVLIESR